MLQKNIDYVLCEKGFLVNSKAPTKHTNGMCLGTKNYIFFIGIQTIGVYPMLQTFRSHRIFQGVSVQQGIANLLNASATVEELEEAFIALLENNPKYVHHIPSYSSFVISGIFIKNNMRLIKSRFDYSACILKPKAVAQEFRDFYGK